MDVNQFLINLKELDAMIDTQVVLLDGNRKKAFQEMQNLFQKLELLLPDWFLLIDQTGIGTNEQILTVLSDMEEAMRTEDSILLADAILFGLQTTARDYIRIIDEAVGDE